MGLQASRRETVTSPFRLEQSRTTPGNGLGMSLVQAVMQLPHLRLELHDNEPDLKVVITFP